jgi:aromatase
MHTFNEQFFGCPPDEAFAYAARVDRWPQLLDHYRWVRFHEGGPEEGGVVEMAARRDFGGLGWPVWWLSRMWVDPGHRWVRYRHLDGVTRGMDVLWRLEPAGTSTRVTVRHEWEAGPRFAGPLAPAVGRWVVGPLFVRSIAGQTLRTLAQHAARGMAM